MCFIKQSNQNGMPIPLVGQCKEVDNVSSGHEFKYYHTQE